MLCAFKWDEQMTQCETSWFQFIGISATVSFTWKWHSEIEFHNLYLAIEPYEAK